MSSLRRINSSRANGARSRGPVTPDGKDRSSQNATRHGLLAKCVVLENESREGFDSLLAQFVARFAPADGVELGLVEEMLSAFWRQRRAWAMETHIMDTAISREPSDHDEVARITDAFGTVAVQPQVELLHRYETRLHRIYQRALCNLVRMRSPALSANTKVRNEPSPISEHPAPTSENLPPLSGAVPPDCAEPPGSAPLATPSGADPQPSPFTPAPSLQSSDPQGPVGPNPRPSVSIRGHCSFHSLRPKANTARGGRVTAMLWSRPWQGTGSECTPPKLPMLLPPNISESLFSNSS